MASKTVFIISLAISTVIAKYIPISENAQPAVCNGGSRMLTEQRLQNCTYDPNNLEAGPYFEGDILGIPDDSYVRNGIIGDKWRWPDNTLIYSVDGQFTDEQLETIQEAHRQITSATGGCIKFREKKDGDQGYVSIGNGRGCSSAVGYHGQKQQLTLADGCFTVGWATVAHEHMHALGFFHQQSSSDRDDWVKIIWENIQEGQMHNFLKQGSTSFGEEYDYDSVMHYGETFFGKDGRQTIVPKRRGVTIGQRDHISRIDARKMMKMYGCM